MPRPAKPHLYLIFFLAVTVLGIQLCRINRPFLGNFATYQGTVMASMARNMIRENFSELLLPKTDSLIGGKRSRHLNQYPFPSLLAALAARGIGGGLEFWGRFQAVVFNAASIVLLGWIAAALFDSLTGWISVILFALAPITLIYGQSFMSEASSLFFFLLALFLLIRKSERSLSQTTILGSGFLFSLALTGRIHWLVFFPVFLLLILNRSAHPHPLGERGRVRGRVLASLLFFSVFSLALPVTWYAHTYFASLTATNVHTNLFMQLGGREPGRFDLGVAQKVFDAISGPYLTPLLFPFLGLGLVLGDRKKKSFWILLSGILGGTLLIFLTPEKVIKHDFYLYAMQPFLVMFAALGVALLVRAFPMLVSQRMVILFLFVLLGVSARYFFHPIFKTPPEETRLISIANFVKVNTHADEPGVVVGTNAGILGYYMDRPNWSFPLRDIGRPLAPYRKTRAISQTEREEMAALERANQNPLNLFDYFFRRGAKFLVAPDRRELEKAPELPALLRTRHEEISTAKDDFYLFRLQN